MLPIDGDPMNWLRGIRHFKKYSFVSMGSLSNFLCFIVKDWHSEDKQLTRDLKVVKKDRVLQYKAEIPALGTWRQENQEFKASLVD